VIFAVGPRVNIKSSLEGSRRDESLKGGRGGLKVTRGGRKGRNVVSIQARRDVTGTGVTIAKFYGKDEHRCRHGEGSRICGAI